MFRKISIVAVIVALAVTAAASATNGHRTVPSPVDLVQIVKDRKAKTTYKQKIQHPTVASVVHAITTIGSLPRQSQERAGYCAPIPMPRVGEQPGLFLNLYADSTSRDLYLAAGLLDARKDPVTGSISC